MTTPSNIDSVSLLKAIGKNPSLIPNWVAMISVLRQVFTIVGCRYAYFVLGLNDIRLATLTTNAANINGHTAKPITRLAALLIKPSNIFLTLPVLANWAASESYALV